MERLIVLAIRAAWNNAGELVCVIARLQVPALVALIVNREAQGIGKLVLEAQVIRDNIGALRILVSSIDSWQVGEIHQPSIRSIQRLAEPRFQRLSICRARDIAVDVLADIWNWIKVCIHVERCVVAEVQSQTIFSSPP